MSLPELIKNKWIVTATIIIGVFSIFGTGYAVHAHEASAESKFVTIQTFAMHEVVNKDTESKVTFQEKQLAVLNQAFEDLKETNKEIRDTLRGYNERNNVPKKTTPFPIRGGN